jgi:hypothetical protein
MTIREALERADSAEIEALSAELEAMPPPRQLGEVAQ